MTIRVLLAGESWISQATHYKGFDSFTSVTYHTGADAYIEAVQKEDIVVTHMPAHEVPQDFPKSIAECEHYDVIILSDIGANSLQLPPETWLHGKSSPDRLATLNDWVANGGGLMMAGGYLSFQGFQARANFARTPLADSLPITMSDFDDRVECSAGARPTIAKDDHPLARLVTADVPLLLGYNRVYAKPDSAIVATVGEDILIATGTYGKGNTLVWTSDIGPHWCPQEFLDWPGFGPLMAGMIKFLAGSNPT